MEKGEIGIMTQNRLRVMKTYTQTIRASKDEIFPLLCPVREKEWLAGWNYEMVYSESGIAEKGCIFKTHEVKKDDTIWFIDHFDIDNYKIIFIRITPSRSLAQMELTLKEETPEITKSIIKYTITALSDAGEKYIEQDFTENFIQYMKWWEKSLNHYLKTGNLLKPNNFFKLLKHHNLFKHR